MKIKEMIPKESATVTGYEKGDKVLREKLVRMGLTRGTEFTLKKIAPLGDPAEISLRGFSLTLRKSEADILIVAANSEKNSEAKNG